MFTLDGLSLIGIATSSLDAGTAIAEGKVTIERAPSLILILVGLTAGTDPTFNIVTPKRLAHCGCKVGEHVTWYRNIEIPRDCHWLLANMRDVLRRA